MAITAEKSVLELEHSSGGIHAIQGLDSTQYFKGMMVYVDANGKLAPVVGSAGATLVVCGVCQETVLTGASNTRKIQFNTGTFGFINAAAGIAQNDVGKEVYAIDNETVGVTAGTNAIAGIVYEVASTTLVFVTIQWPRNSSQTVDAT